MGSFTNAKFESISLRIFLIVCLDESECVCPFCHTPLSGHGTYRRKLIMKCGCRIQLDIPVGICPACRHVHVEQPSFIRPTSIMSSLLSRMWWMVNPSTPVWQTNLQCGAGRLSIVRQRRILKHFCALSRRMHIPCLAHLC